MKYCKIRFILLPICPFILGIIFFIFGIIPNRPEALPLFIFHNIFGNGRSLQRDVLREHTR